MTGDERGAASLHLLSGGAAKGLVEDLRSGFETATGTTIAGTFGAVGAMREKLVAGAACDVVILTAKLIDELAAAGLVVADSAVALGRVRTGIALRTGDATVDVSDGDALKSALLASRGIYVPDPERSTAGIHFAGVLEKLGIADAVAPALRPWPNGATAMARLAESSEPHAIGCTQVTEILYTPGVELVDVLPREFELATVYVGALCTGSTDPVNARRLLALLSGPSSLALRAAGGFED